MKPLKLLLLAWSVTALLPSQGQTEPHAIAARSQLAVDLINLKSGQSVRGVYFSADASTITMVVGREWLKEALPSVYLKATTDEDRVQKQVIVQLRTRLEQELENAPNESRLKFFLKSERERIEARSTGSQLVTPSQFIWVSLPPHSIAKVTRAAPERLRIAGWAWNEGLSHVETRDFHDLERELKHRHIDPAAPAPDLAEKLPPRQQDDREWAARMAIVDYTLRKPVNFEGTAEVLIRSNGERTGIDFAPIISKLMQSQVESFLKDLTSEANSTSQPILSRNWLKSASREADQESARGLRATQVIVKSEGKQAVVQQTFAARMPDKSWEVVWSHLELRDGTVQRAKLETTILADPQVKQVLNTLTATGFRADDQMEKAIRFGAATMEAQQAADALFMKFCDHYTKRLDTPPLVWSK